MAAEDVETLGTVIRRRATSTPDHLAICLGKQTLSYAELDRNASRVAAALDREGIAAGDIVAVLAATSLPYLALMAGTARANVVLAPLPVSATISAVAGMLADAAPKRVFTDRPDLLPKDVSPDIVVDLRDAQFEHWLADPEGVEDQLPKSAGEPATIIYSSGTTGTPKGIVQSHRYRSTIMANAVRRGYSDDTVTLLATPLYSNTTLASLVPTISSGGTVVLMNKFDTGEWLRLAERWRATNATVVPVMCQRLLAHPDFASTDLSSLRMTVCTSAPFAIALKREALERWPGGLTEIYGTTEVGALFALLVHEYPNKLQTVGQVMPGCEVRILDAEDRDVPRGKQGEIVGRSPGMVLGYHNRPTETAESCWTAPEGTVWQRTGDIGWLDDDGFLTIVDRKKDVIISGGFNIYPSDIEAQLADHPAVQDASVVGVPSITWGETPVAFVVATGTSKEEIKEWVNARVSKIQRVADVVLVDALPRGPIGKVLKRELRDRYVADHRGAG